MFADFNHIWRDFESFCDFINDLFVSKQQMFISSQ